MKFRNSMLVLAATLGTSALLANPAAAQGIENIGNAGQFVIGAERITGVFFDKVKTEPEGGGEVSDSTTSIALLGNAGGDGPSSVPRLGFDYLVTDGLSVGGSFVVFSQSGETEPDGGDSVDTPSLTSIYFNPRVGYAYAIDDTFGIWPRAGIGFLTFSGDEGEGGADVSGNSFQLTLEGNVVVSPFEHFAFIGGPFLDLGLSGSVEREDDGETAEADRKYTSYGLAIGIAGYFGD
jgi:hypothetical protein